MFDFSSLPLRRAFSKAPMTFFDSGPRNFLGAVLDVVAIETGGPSARRSWQQDQLRNLVTHALDRSAFWRAKIGNIEARDINLANLPGSTRVDVQQQVRSEGPLLRDADKIPIRSNATSGSSAVPLNFFITRFNAQFNVLRAIAQYFMEQRDFRPNRTRLRQSDHVANPFKVERTSSWMTSEGSFIKTGAAKAITLSTFIKGRDAYRALVRELTANDIGYLICSPRHLEVLRTHSGLDFLRAAKAAMWIPYGEEISPHLREEFARLSIPIRATYSSEEVGLIGSECETFAGHYHVATSNVIVEAVDHSNEVDGSSVGRLIVTHLHSYATPFIRYDLGDLGCLRDDCPCGHEGPTISNLHGRSARLLKHRDGKLSSFYIVGEDLAALAKFDEYRIRQTSLNKIVIEVGGRTELSGDEAAAMKTFLAQRTGPEFEIEVKACSTIDWGQARKRPAFRCEV